jgi:hypothetical protein
VSVDYDDFDSSYVRNANGNLVRVAPGSAAWDVYNNSSRLGVRAKKTWAAA